MYHVTQYGALGTGLVPFSVWNTSPQASHCPAVTILEHEAGVGLGAMSPDLNRAGNFRRIREFAGVWLRCLLPATPDDVFQFLRVYIITFH